MVQVVENWALLEGTVQAVVPSEVRADLADVHLVVDAVEPVDPYPNLLGETLNTTISVIFPSDVVRDHAIEPGARLRCQARRASPFAIFARADDVTAIKAQTC